MTTSLVERESRDWLRNEIESCEPEARRVRKRASKERRTPGLPRGSSERLTLTGRGGRLDRVQHAMAPDRVFKGGAELRPLAIVAGETRVRSCDVGARTLRRC